MNRHFKDLANINKIQISNFWPQNIKTKKQRNFRISNKLPSFDSALIFFIKSSAAYINVALPLVMSIQYWERTKSTFIRIKPVQCIDWSFLRFGGSYACHFFLFTQITYVHATPGIAIHILCVIVTSIEESLVLRQFCSYLAENLENLTARNYKIWCCLHYMYIADQWGHRYGIHNVRNVSWHSALMTVWTNFSGNA